MGNSRFDLLRDYLTADFRIEQKERELEALRKEKRAAEETISKLLGSGDRRWKVVYFHFVKGMSLSQCAAKFHYSRQGVCKIIRSYREKLK